MNTLTCVYCGTAYPEGTPPHGAKILTDHIKVCPKHPMRQAEIKIRRLRAALIGLIGLEDKVDLEGMKKLVVADPHPSIEKEATLGAIQALIDTVED